MTTACRSSSRRGCPTCTRCGRCTHTLAVRGEKEYNRGFEVWCNGVSAYRHCQALAISTNTTAHTLNLKSLKMFNPILFYIQELVLELTMDY